MKVRSEIAIEVCGGEFRAVAVEIHDGGVRVLRTIAEPFPSQFQSVKSPDAASWINQRLRGANLQPLQVTFVIGHDEYSFERERFDLANGSDIQKVRSRTDGIFAIVQSLSDQRLESRNTLVVDAADNCVEIYVISDGEVCFEHTARVPEPYDRLALVETVVTESHRVWKLHQSSRESLKLTSVTFLGDALVGGYAAQPMEQLLQAPVHVLRSHPLIDPSGHSMDKFWSLAGVFLDRIDEEIAPIESPQVASTQSARHVAVPAAAAVFITIVALAAGWLYAKDDLQSLQMELDTLIARQELNESNRKQRQSDHDLHEQLKEWQSLDVNWLRSFACVIDAMPGQDQLVFKSCKGQLRSDDLIIEVSGEAADQATAESFVDSIDRLQTYTASMTGPEVESGSRLPVMFSCRFIVQKKELAN